MLSKKGCWSAAVSIMCCALAALPLAAQRTAADTRQRAVSGSSSGAPVAQSSGQVEVINGSSRWTGDADSHKADTVEVINGLSRRTQVLNEEPTTNSGQKKGSKRILRGEAIPYISNVEMINGAQWETRQFEGFEDEIATPWIERRTERPVVVGVASAESARKTSSAAQVVVEVASSDSAGQGGEVKPLAYRVEPRPPKRPAYRPESPNFK
jgi:hypothetical protein